MIAKWGKSWNVSYRISACLHFFLRRDRAYSFENLGAHHPIAAQLFLYHDSSTSDGLKSTLYNPKTCSEFSLQNTMVKTETLALLGGFGRQKMSWCWNKKSLAATNIIPPWISLRFVLTALSTKFKDAEILLAKRGEKVFGKSKIRQNCLTRRHSPAFPSI